MERLPFDVIINHIIPYTYQIQPKLLLADIRSYSKTFEFVQNRYTFDYNFFVLLIDLICFCNKEDIPSFAMTFEYGNVLRRHVMYTKYSHIKLEYLLYLFFLDSVHDNTCRKIRFLWGLMEPCERVKFIDR